jgi:hypothetical protein
MLSLLMLGPTVVSLLYPGPLLTINCNIHSFGSWTKVSALDVGKSTVLVGTTSVLGNDDVKVYGVESGLVQHTLPGHYRGVTCIGL